MKGTLKECMLKDAESSRSSTQDGEDQKLEVVRKISALICKVAKRRAERCTFVDTL